MARTDKEILMAVLESMGEPAAIRGYVIAAVQEAIRMTREDEDYLEEEDEEEVEELEEEEDAPECGDCGSILKPEEIILCKVCDIELCSSCTFVTAGTDIVTCAECEAPEDEEEYEDEELVIGDDEPRDQAV
jgi:hypothetical protein